MVRSNGLNKEEELYAEINWMSVEGEIAKILGLFHLVNTAKNILCMIYGVSWLLPKRKGCVAYERQYTRCTLLDRIKNVPHNTVLVH